MATSLSSPTARLVVFTTGGLTTVPASSWWFLLAVARLPRGVKVVAALPPTGRGSEKVYGEAYDEGGKEAKGEKKAAQAAGATAEVLLWRYLDYKLMEAIELASLVMDVSHLKASAAVLHNDVQSLVVETTREKADKVSVVLHLLRALYSLSTLCGGDSAGGAAIRFPRPPAANRKKPKVYLYNGIDLSFDFGPSSDNHQLMIQAVDTAMRMARAGVGSVSSPSPSASTPV